MEAWQGELDGYEEFERACQAKAWRYVLLRFWDWEEFCEDSSSAGDFRFLADACGGDWPRAFDAGGGDGAGD
jgi:hypothetical protein